MQFEFLDSILELTPERIVACKHVSLAEEYLQDHFPSFPVLPGVLMLETMTQAARRLLRTRDPELARHVLGSVRALKYGAMVRPGETLTVDVSLVGEASGSFEFKGAGSVSGVGHDAPRNAVSGRFSLRPLRTGDR